MLERIQKMTEELGSELNKIPADYYVPYKDNISFIHAEIDMLSNRLREHIEKNYFTTLKDKLTSMLDLNHISWDDAETIFVCHNRSRRGDNSIF
jgi:hypothetical protein